MNPTQQQATARSLSILDRLMDAFMDAPVGESVVPALSVPDPAAAQAAVIEAARVANDATPVQGAAPPLPPKPVRPKPVAAAASVPPLPPAAVLPPSGGAAPVPPPRKGAPKKPKAIPPPVAVMPTAPKAVVPPLAVRAKTPVAEQHCNKWAKGTCLSPCPNGRIHDLSKLAAPPGAAPAAAVAAVTATGAATAAPPAAAPAAASAAPAAAPAVAPAKHYSRTIGTDCRLTEGQLEDIEQEFGVKVINGHKPTAHPIARTQRFIMEELALGALMRTSKVLEMQGRLRGKGTLHDICRVRLYAGDEDAGLLCTPGASGTCAHEHGLLTGKYDTLFFLDVALPADDAANLFRKYLHIKSIYLALHLYTGIVAHSAEQIAVWRPSDDPPVGSVGMYSVTAPGMVAVTEGDNFWLTTQRVTNGIRPEHVQYFPASGYAFIRLTKTVTSTPEPIAINISHVLGPTHPGVYQAGDMVIYKYGPQFAVWRSPTGCIPFVPDEVQSEWRATAGKAIDNAVLLRLAQRIARTPDVETHPEAIIALVREIKVQEERPFLALQYRPSRSGWFSWLRRDVRALEASNAALRTGSSDLPRASGFWQAILSFLILTLTFVPWPDVVVSVVTTPIPWGFSVNPTTFNYALPGMSSGFGSVNLTLPMPTFRFSTGERLTDHWTLIFTYAAWHIGLRGAVLASSLFLFIGAARASVFNAEPILTANTDPLFLYVAAVMICVALVGDNLVKCYADRVGRDYPVYARQWLYTVVVAQAVAYGLGQNMPYFSMLLLPALAVQRALVLRGRQFGVHTIGILFFLLLQLFNAGIPGVVAETTGGPAPSVLAFPSSAEDYFIVCMIVVAGLGAAYILAVCCGPEPFYGEDDPVRRAYITSRFEPVDHEGPLPLNERFSYGLPGYISSNPLLPMQPGAKVKVRPIDKPEPLDRNVLFATGVVTGAAIPSVAFANQSNLIVAVRNRQVAAMPDYDQLEFSRYSDAYIKDAMEWKKFAEVRSGLQGPFSDVGSMGEALLRGNLFPDYSWHRVYPEWDARFTGARRSDHAQAEHNLLCAPTLTARDLEQRKTFMKIEKIFKREGYDPRCITGCTDEFNVVYGPYIYWLTKAFKTVFNADSPLFFASGTTSASLGAWFDSAEPGDAAVCGDDMFLFLRLPDSSGRLRDVLIEIDGNRHDAHQHFGFLTLVERMYRVFDPPPHAAGIDACIKSKHTTYAVSNLGVSFMHKERVNSGMADTFLGNSVAAGLVVRTVGQLLTAGHTRSEVVEMVKRQLGYEVKLKTSMSAADVTFLSGLFMPFNGVTFWVPKPGRLLASLGWTTTRPGARSRYRDLASSLNSFATYRAVPFLRFYIPAVLRLIPDEFRTTRLSEPRMVYGDDFSVDSPSDDTWAFIGERYGLTVADEQTFQVSLSRVTSLPFMLCDGSYNRMTEVDCY